MEDHLVLVGQPTEVPQEHHSWCKVGEGLCCQDMEVVGCWLLATHSILPLSITFEGFTLSLTL